MIGEYMVLPTPLITHNESCCVIKKKGFYFSNSKIVFFSSWLGCSTF